MGCGPLPHTEAEKMQQKYGSKFPDNLKPCPWCESNAIGYEIISNQGRIVYARGVCQDCKARGPIGRDDGSSEFRGEWARKWNNRGEKIPEGEE